MAPKELTVLVRRAMKPSIQSVDVAIRYRAQAMTRDQSSRPGTCGARLPATRNARNTNVRRILAIVMRLARVTRKKLKAES